MASKLCCTTEQQGRTGSPDLPNIRVSAATPAKRPLLPKQAGSPNSHFTSARSDELHELRQIFEDARDRSPKQASPSKGVRTRSSRQSMYSLHSLHKMTSMRSIIRRKFSKDIQKKNSVISNKLKKKASIEEPATVIKHSKHEPKAQFNITKDNLRKDLLSDKKPDEGGYDSDAQVLDDVARNIGKKTPSKRPSIHSVEWTPSTNSKSTPGSSREGRHSKELVRDVQPYQIQRPQAISMASRFTHVFSTPNLRADGPKEKDRELRRSHSATSMGLPIASPLSPLRLPSLTSQNQDGIPWSESMHQSLRLSQFPVPPRHHTPEPSETTASSGVTLKPHNSSTELQRTGTNKPSNRLPDQTTIAPARAVEIRIQQPTSIATPRASTSVRGGFRETAHPQKGDTIEQVEDEEDENNPRRSVHLYSMRISHHLRSGSLLSWDQLAADAPDLPTPPRLFRERSVSDQSRYSSIQTQLARHDRQTSSSGFASSKIPIKWGKVVPHDHDLRGDVASSMYSSRPQSPPDSFGGSMVNISQHHTSSRQSFELKMPRRSSSFPTDNEDTPRPVQRYGTLNQPAAQRSSTTTALLEASYPLSRMNSVADTKKSKFREEFSPSPPRKKVTASSSMMHFLNPKRLSLRSLSEANIQADTHPTSALDGPFDTLPIPADRERRQSRSMISLQAEKEALGKNKGANHVWDTALKAHQEERAAMFLPQNRDLAVHASPFRERSGSSATRRPSFVEDVEAPAKYSDTPPRVSTPLLAPDHPAPEYPPALLSRRSATAGRDELGVGQDVAAAFEKQGDSPAVVGAWGRYPSHTRPERTLSAGKGDRVETRDFALEAAVRFASARDDDYDEDLIDPTDRLPSPPVLPGEKKRKKKVGSGKMPKSHSMTFGRKLIKNYYSGMFKSSSTEFRRHGRGHRSSIASGGTLENPELEMIPDVFMSGATDGAGDVQQDRNDKQVVRRHSERHVLPKSKETLPTENSVATLRPRCNSSAPNLKDLAAYHDGADDSKHAQDRARVWSVYYETCVPSFPRLSTEGDFGLADFGGPSRMSNDSKRASMHSHTMPMRRSKHGRHVSQISHISRRSGRSDSLTVGDAEDDGASVTRSLVSVRRSTMDLISKFKEQENREHERVMSLTLGGSSGEGAGILVV